MTDSEFAETILEPDLPIVDPHHHIWYLPDSLLDALDGFEDKDGKAVARTYRLHRRYLLDELLADLNSGHNVVATVFTDAHAMYRAEGPDEFKSLGEIEFVTGYAAVADSRVFGDCRFCEGIVGGVDLAIGDRAGAVLDAHMQAAGGRYRGVRPPNVISDDRLEGLKHMLGKPHVMRDPKFLEGARLLAPRGLSLDIFVFASQLQELVELAQKLPDTQIILDHTGGPLGIGPYAENRDEHFAFWRDEMRKVAECDNVALKVGGLGMALCGFPTSALEERAGSDRLAEDWRPHIETAIEIFGAERCMFESNFPIDGVTARYPSIWNAFKRVVADYSPDEKRALFSGTAARIYRVDI